MSEPRPTPAPLEDKIRSAHKETLEVFKHTEGNVSPRQAAKQAADYMLEVLLINFREPLAPPPPAALPASAPVVRQVGCEDSDGLLHLHPESETCEVCKPTAAAPLAPALSETE